MVRKVKFRSQAEIAAENRRKREAILRKIDENERKNNEGRLQMNIHIKRIHPDAVIPKYATAKAAGFDLVAVEDVIIPPGETRLIPTGLAFEIPEGYEMQIRPRSGISNRTKLRVANSPGTADSDYRGEIKVIIENTNRPAFLTDDSVLLIDGTTQKDPFEFREIGTYLIRKGDRIAQAVIAPVVRVEFVEVEKLNETERGDGGFGSTGVKS